MASMSEAVVYVVDDDDAIRSSLAILLDAYDIPVLTFASPAEFLQTELVPCPCCLVLDARLPGMSGLDMLRCLSQSGRSIPCIMITGHGDKDLFDDAAGLGVRQCFRKPFDGSELIASIQAVLADQFRDAG